MSDAPQKPADEFDAARTVVGVLKAFKPDEQARIIRWAQEALGIIGAPGPSQPPAPLSGASVPSDGSQNSDIRSFIETKKPSSDVQFAAAVAYFHAFIAPTKKAEITATDLQEATRLANRDRLHKPIITLHNAAKRGYLDKGSERGAFKINTVGENLVAMSLPTPNGADTTSKKAKARKSK
jgi:hypothetical protein